MAHLVKVISADTFEEEVLNADKPVIVDVYADWCGPCRMMAPTFQSTAESHGEKYKFVKANLDDCRDIASKYNVYSIPAFLFFVDGKLVGSAVGYMGQEELEEKLFEFFHP